MEEISGLYKIMLLLSAVVMLMGFILNMGRIGKRPSYFKMLLLLAVVNIISISDYLLQLKPATGTGLAVPLVFLNSIILILNLIVSHFIYKCYSDADTKYDKQIINLFIFTFLAECFFIFLVFFFRSEAAFFDLSKKGFPFIFGFTVLLLVWGTLIPGVKALINLRKGKQEKHLLFLLALNMVNNFIGLFFYSLRYPTYEISLVLNMIANLAFAYYFGYYLLSEYFRLKKVFVTGARGPQPSYSWQELRAHLSHWSDARSYLMLRYPEIVEEVEKYSLSDLEKIHYMLKLLNVKAKEVATAFNITIRAVEMHRYRIKKKINKDVADS